MAIFLSTIFLCLSLNTYALDVDSKFLATIMGLSESKKTIMINKGKEQGLRMDMHAKLSMPSGIVARGVVVKVSPSRSVWSLYRIWKKDKLEKSLAILFKVSEAVRLTGDETKALGKIAEKVNKKTEKINMTNDDARSQEKQNKIKKSMFIKDKKTSVYTKEDFSSLEEKRTPGKVDQEVDWSGLDGKKDTRNFDRQLDYTNLN
jgi:cell shape-determining protein MreC